MTKVAIKSDKITSFGGIFHVMDVFPNLDSIKSLSPRLVSVAVQVRHSNIVILFHRCFIAIYVVVIAWKILTRSLLSFHYLPNVHFLGQTLLVVV